MWNVAQTKKNDGGENVGTFTSLDRAIVIVRQV